MDDFQTALRTACPMLSALTHASGLECMHVFLESETLREKKEGGSYSVFCVV